MRSERGAWAKGQHTDAGTRDKDFAHAGQAITRRKWEPRFHPGVSVGKLNSSSEAVVVTVEGLAVTRAAKVKIIPESERWDADQRLGMRAVPWSPDGSDNAFDIQVGSGEHAGMVPRLLGEVLMESTVLRMYLRRQTSNSGVSVKVVLGAVT